MVTYTRVVVLLAVAAALAAVFYVSRQATAPESTIIASERSRQAAAFDKARAGRDAVYAAEFREKTAFLDYRMAIALIRENKPDQAIPVLKKLIDDEESTGTAGARRFRSYQNEDEYYAALEQAYELKNDAAAVQKAGEMRKGLVARADEAKRRERQEEGKWVGTSRD